jgi:hypothetical protein
VWLRAVTDVHPLQVVGPMAVTPSAERRRLDLELADGTSLSGRVLRDGRPVGPRRLAVMRGDGERWAVVETKALHTSAEGRFVVRGLWSGTWGVATEREPVVPEATFTVAPGEGERELDLVLDAGRR